MKRKCRPQKWPDQGRCLCECLKKIDPQRLFRENTCDVAKAIIEVMKLCGIHECKAQSAREVILNAFTHYDEVRHRIDAVPKKSLRKEYLIHVLGCKCMMTRIEAQLAYTIIKRAFKAFYYGTSEFGLRNPIIEAQLIHTQECLWVHAAKRTAQIYVEYEGMFFPTQKRFEERIKCIYGRLYERLKKRADPIKLAACCCQNCIKRTIPSDYNKADDKTSAIGTNENELNLEPNDSDSSTINEMKSEQTVTKIPTDPTKKLIETKQNLEKLPRCTQCKCPKLVCECKIDHDTGILNYECSQGPFKVRWIRIDEDAVPDPCITKPENHVCPIDCDDLSVLSSEDEDSGECICTGICECEDEATEGAETISELEQRNEEADDEKSTELSDTRTVYSCHLPEVNLIPVMLPDKNICDKQTMEAIKAATRKKSLKPKPDILRPSSCYEETRESYIDSTRKITEALKSIDQRNYESIDQTINQSVDQPIDTARLSGGSKTLEWKKNKESSQDLNSDLPNKSIQPIHKAQASVTEALTLENLKPTLLSLAKKMDVDINIDSKMSKEKLDKTKNAIPTIKGTESDKGYHSDIHSVSNKSKDSPSVAVKDNKIPNQGFKDIGYHSDANPSISRKILKSAVVKRKQVTSVNAVSATMKDNLKKTSSLKNSKSKGSKNTWALLTKKKKKVSFSEKSAGSHSVGSHSVDENKIPSDKPFCS